MTEPACQVEENRNIVAGSSRRLQSFVHALYAALNNDPKLAEFNFVRDWPSLKPDEMAGIVGRAGVTASARLAALA